MDNDTFSEHYDYINKIIQKKARRFLKTPFFTEADIEEATHDVWEDILIRTKKFDPTRSSYKTFLNRIVTNKIIGILAYNFAAKRDKRKTYPLFVDSSEVSSPHDDEPRPFDAASYLRSTSSDTCMEERDLDLLIDLKRGWELLTPSQQDLLWLVVTTSISHAARELNTTRHQIRKELGGIQRIFELAGLSDYRD